MQCGREPGLGGSLGGVLAWLTEEGSLLLGERTSLPFLVLITILCLVPPSSSLAWGSRFGGNLWPFLLSFCVHDLDLLDVHMTFHRSACARPKSLFSEDAAILD